MTTVTINHSTFPFLPGQVFNFTEPITVLVGDIGVGKSTILKLIATEDPAVLINRTCKNIIWWDSELGNPRTRNYEILDFFLQYVNNIEISNEEKLKIGKIVKDFLVLNSEESTLTCSHGEKLFPILESIKSHTGSLILLDEPDSGLSIKKVEEFVKIIRSTLEHGTEYIIATHSPVLISKVSKVFNMETGSYEDSKYYLERTWNR